MKPTNRIYYYSANYLHDSVNISGVHVEHNVASRMAVGWLPTTNKQGVSLWCG